MKADTCPLSTMRTEITLLERSKTMHVIHRAEIVDCILGQFNPIYTVA
jgi:hypothetical protein